MSKFVDDIPTEFLPSEEEHIEHKHTIRALRNSACDINSFLPTFIERNQNSFLSEDPSDKATIYIIEETYNLNGSQSKKTNKLISLINQ